MVHYNKEILPVMKITYEDGNVITFTDDMGINDISRNIKYTYNITKLEIFSSIKKYNFESNSSLFNNWYRLETIIINENVTTFPINLTFSEYYHSSISNLVIRGKSYKILYNDNIQIIINGDSVNSVYADKAILNDVENYKKQNNYSFSVYSLDSFNN